MPDSAPDPLPQPPQAEGDPPAEPDPPEYSKPRLRRYDQIEQVKPYGPSDRRAG